MKLVLFAYKGLIAQLSVWSHGLNNIASTVIYGEINWIYARKVHDFTKIYTMSVNLA